MSRSKEFTKNTIILLIGKFSTQFMSLFLLPLYTNRFSAENYGYVDLIKTYISLFIPIFSLRLDSAAFRFLIDCRSDKQRTKSVISSISFLLFCGLAAIILLGIPFCILVKAPYIAHVIINLCVLLISGVFLQFLRGLGKILDYSICSVITGVSTLLVNIVLVLGYNFDASSILISSSIANLLCILYVIIRINLPKLTSIKSINKGTIRELLSYSLPMIPNALSWWVVNASDRTIISTFISKAANGIYSVSCKFSNVLNGVFQIFNMSWQESASLHIDDPDRDEYFSKMINSLLIFFGTISLLIVAGLPVVYDILIGEEFISSYSYIPILLYANIWDILTNLIGGIYIAKKKTKEVASTTLAAAAINLVVHLVLVRFIGLYAACISTLVSYLAMSLYRYRDCQKYVKLKIDFRLFSLFTLVFIICSILYLQKDIIACIFGIVIACIFSFLANRRSIKTILSVLKSKRTKSKIKSSKNH